VDSPGAVVYLGVEVDRILADGKDITPSRPTGMVGETSGA